MGDDVTQEQAFAHANDVLKNAVGGISDIIHIPGLVNVDFEDVKTVMSEPGKAMMGTAVAVACPLLKGIDLSGPRRPAGGTTRLLRAVCRCWSPPARPPSS